MQDDAVLGPPFIQFTFNNTSNSRVGPAQRHSALLVFLILVGENAWRCKDLYKVRKRGIGSCRNHWDHILLPKISTLYSREQIHNISP